MKSFISYGVGAGLTRTVTMVILATSNEIMIKFFHKLLSHMDTINIVLMIFVGVLVVFQIYLIINQT